MRKLIRLLVLWLLALALPVQGVAAATMLHCGSERGHASDLAGHPSMGVVAHAQSIVVIAAVTAEHAHHGRHGHSTIDAAEPAHDHASHDKGSCSTCASCCSAAALLTTATLPMPATVVRAAALALPTALAAAFLTDGPDRPPRSILG